MLGNGKTVILTGINKKMEDEWMSGWVNGLMEDEWMGKLFSEIWYNFKN